MFRKMKWFIALLLVLGICTGTALGELIAYWPFDEGQGTDVSDVTGNGNDGTFNGAVEWVSGVKGTAVRFDVDSERITIGPIDPTAANNAMTLAAWIKWENPPGEDQQGIFGKRIWTPRDLTKWFWEARENGRLSFRNGDQTLAAPAGTLTPYVNEWIHVAVTWDDGATIQYINAQEIHSGNITLRTTADATPVTIGTTQGGETFHGTIDEARIYDTALTPGQIDQAMKGDTTSASAPQPETGATDVHRDPLLSWAAGEFAASHDVYFGMDFNDVNEASRTDGRGVLVSQDQTGTTYDVGRKLQIDTIYYWRVDEVNSPPDSTIFKGEVWSFTTEPFAYAIGNITATASSSDVGREPENTINGSGLDDSGLLHGKDPENNMWLSSMAGPQPTWIEFQFDRVYKLHEMWVWNSNESLEPVIGLGFKDVSIEYSANGTDYTTLGATHEFARAPGTPDYAHNTTVDLSGVAAKYVKLTANSNWGGILPQFGLSEVRFLHIPVLAREPNPESGARDVSIGTIYDPADITLGFRAGREAAKHDVYFGSDWQAVIDGTATVTTVTEAGHGPLSLDLAQTYYWRVDEVNEAETPTTWQGPVWDFTTQKYFVVDDFESYNDLDPTDLNSNRIFLTWLDGYEVATNGSLVGYDVPPFTEQSIVNGGNQSMPFFFDNSGTAQYSEATLTLTSGRDWTIRGTEALSLWFFGDPNNTPGQMYVKVNGTKVPYDGNAGNLLLLSWQVWNIDLASVGTNLQNVTTVSVGIDGNSAAGKLLFDDIRLYPHREPPDEIALEAEAADSITAPMKIYDDPGASVGQYIGTDVGIGDENDNPPADGIATYSFTAKGGVYKILLSVIITEGNNSFWVRIPGAISYDPGTDPANPGWIKFNDIEDGDTWHWDEVHSNDHNNEVVLIKLPPGPHTLEIVRREEGALLDAILITNAVD